MENILQQNVGSIINYSKQSTEVAEWGTPSCSRPQPATDNGLRDGKSNLLFAPPPSGAVPSERLVHSINRCSLSSPGTRLCYCSMRGNHLAYAATQGETLVSGMRPVSELLVRGFGGHVLLCHRKMPRARRIVAYKRGGYHRADSVIESSLGWKIMHLFI